MKDTFNRTIDYLRVSVTDRCNLRCVYCMPEKAPVYSASENRLTDEELLKILRAAASLGVERIKITGGEPLLRPKLPELIASIHAVPGILEVTLTTNGLFLEKQLEDLVKAGIRAVNISLDALDPELYRAMTRGAEPEPVLLAVDKALEMGLKVKINCLPIKGMNEGELAAIAGLARSKPLSVRFIELMPLGFGRGYEPVPTQEVIKRIEEAYGKLSPFQGRLGNGPARYWTLPGFKGSIGFITPLSGSFCENCNRARLTSTGFFKTCLHSLRGVDLGSPVKQGASFEELTQLMIRAVNDKPPNHTFCNPSAADGGEGLGMFQFGG